MEDSRFSTSTALAPDFTAFAEGVKARLPQQRALAPDVVKGIKRLGRLVRILRIRQHWSLQTLASRTGLPWLWLALLDEGMLLPHELTDEALDRLGQAFPPKGAMPTPVELFRHMARVLCTLSLPAEGAPVPRVVQATQEPRPPISTQPPETQANPRRRSGGGRVWHWLPARWVAGERLTAAVARTRSQTFYLDGGEGRMRVTCRAWPAESGKPALLKISWRADIAQVGTFWARFTRPNDETVMLAEVRLGNTSAGEAALHDLGFDPAYDPWALSILLKEPAG